MNIRRPTTTLAERRSGLRDPAEQLRLLRQVPLPDEFEDRLGCADLSPLRATGIEVLQVNVGKLCNMTCQHCHVDAGPDRTDAMMERATFERVLELLADSDIPTVDITGGAPELNPEFRWFVSEVRELDRHVMSRCNLTILLSAPHEDLPRFFADHEIEVVASLPHHRPADTDRQRGEGTFAASIEAIRRLNDVGYGRGDERRQLDLVMNPVGTCLPGSQASLESEWQEALLRDHGVTFDRLFTITNMPISRFLEFLVSTDSLEPYLRSLYEAFNLQAAAGVMCRTTLSVGWDGKLYDCDFNQMLELTVDHGLPTNIHDASLERFLDRQIVTGRHCFGCTAGAGSSCGGSIAG
ncbi:arsenosugar biosynthesis radical SAM (seleno)protein ArsS [Gemmatimonadota bacterium]